MSDTAKPAGLLERLRHHFGGDAPQSRADLAQLLRASQEGGLIDDDTLQRLEKVLSFADLDVRDVMVTRSHMDVIKADDTPERIIAYAVETAHSRFPVIDGDKDNILGILHAKDLLKYWHRPDQFHIEQILREAVFVPESKSLTRLLKEFREQHNHMAIVVDEYGGISGLVTFEDVLEQIIGEIEDEFDADDVRSTDIESVSADRFRVHARTELEDFNAFFGTQFDSEEIDSIGGLVIRQFGHLPIRGEKTTIDGFQFAVARADTRRLHTLMVTIPKGYTLPESDGVA